MDELIKLINTVGFPIAAFLLIFYQSNITIKENTKAIRDLGQIIREIKR